MRRVEKMRRWEARMRKIDADAGVKVTRAITEAINAYQRLKQEVEEDRLRNPPRRKKAGK